MIGAIVSVRGFSYYLAMTFYLFIQEKNEKNTYSFDFAKFFNACGMFSKWSE